MNFRATCQFTRLIVIDTVASGIEQRALQGRQIGVESIEHLGAGISADRQIDVDLDARP